MSPFHDLDPVQIETVPSKEAADSLILLGQNEIDLMVLVCAPFNSFLSTKPLVPAEYKRMTRSSPEAPKTFPLLDQEQVQSVSSESKNKQIEIVL